MNKNRQFWALLKFQTAISPIQLLFILPLVLATPYFITFFVRFTVHAYHPGLNQLLINQNIFMVGIMGFMLLAPEILRSAAMSAQWPTGTELILTRAVDRRLVFRARAVFFYLLILALPLCAFAYALTNSTLQIDEFQKAVHQQILDHIAGSISGPAGKGGVSNEITIPGGNTLVEGWRIALILCFAAATQVAVFLIYPLKYRRAILWGSYVGLIGIYLFLTLRSISGPAGPSLSERMFFVFAAHQPAVWVCAIVALLLSEYWCESRFAATEQ